MDNGHHKRSRVELLFTSLAFGRAIASASGGAVTRLRLRSKSERLSKSEGLTCVESLKAPSCRLRRGAQSSVT